MRYEVRCQVTGRFGHHAGESEERGQVAELCGQFGADVFHVDPGFMVRRLDTQDARLPIGLQVDTRHQTIPEQKRQYVCLLYTSDAADE